MLMSQGREARLRYMPNGFRVLVAGDHVTCAVTGQPIAIDRLRYWNVARQEPYATSAASAKAEFGL